MSPFHPDTNPTGTVRGFPPIKLRPYQEKAVSAIYEAWQEHRSIMLQLPTGGGKTVIFSRIIQLALENGAKQIAVLTHREELLKQAEIKIRQFCPYGIGIIQGQQAVDIDQPIQLVSIMTLARRCQLLNQLAFDLIVIDEAHHATAHSYSQIIDHFPRAKILGVTATPCRTDGTGFGDLFDILIDSHSISADVKTLIRLNYLSDFKIYATPCVETKGVGQRGGDYDEASLARLNPVKKIRGSLLHSYLAYGKSKKCVCFAINVEHSQAIAQYYNQYGIPALHLDGAMPPKERQAIIAQFRHGHTLILCNCNIITEGFDLPEIEVVQLARPTQSLALYLQMVGRALRYKPNKTAIILDHANNWQIHGSPKDDFTWTLTGVVKTTNHHTLPREIEITPTPPTPPQSIHQDHTLTEINTTTLELLKLQKTQLAKGYKKGWIAYRFLESPRTRTELIQCADFLGYNQQWVNFILKQQTSCK